MTFVPSAPGGLELPKRSTNTLPAALTRNIRNRRILQKGFERPRPRILSRGLVDQLTIFVGVERDAPAFNRLQDQRCKPRGSSGRVILSSALRFNMRG
jgi:hypothetical protein